MDAHEPSVSIVMPALDEARYLDQTFDAIDALDYPQKRLEVILVDNGSRDPTVAIASRRGAQVLEAPGVTVGELRNRGARVAEGEILAFLDSDCSPSRTWLRRALAPLADPHVGATGAHTRPPAGATWVEQTLDFFGTRHGRRQVEFLPTANLIVPRRIFEEVGGFSSEMRTGEDSDFCHRIRALGYLLISDDGIHVVHHDYPKTLGALFRKEMWHSAELFRLLQETRYRPEYVRGVLAPLLWAGALALAAILLVASIWTGEPRWLVAALAALVSMPVVVASYKSIGKRSWRFFLPAVPFFGTILLARIASGLRSLARTGRRD